ncbi:accessory Sec system glycosylation chaperone GtfB [Roseburia hominis]
MGSFTWIGETVLLLDRLTPDGEYLYESFKQAGYDCFVMALEENYFLPEDVMSVYDLLLGYGSYEVHPIKPRYFNEIEVPDYWSINKGDLKSGTICYQHEEKGRIRYAAIKKKYIVDAVDWYDRKGVVRVTDHYNRYGVICARTVYNAEGQQINKSWFSAEGKERIVENYITGDIIFNDGDIVKFFRRKMDLLYYFFEKIDFAGRRIFYNSLSTPFLISNHLPVSDAGRKDILFWQEPIGEGIPGNMQIILRGEAGRTDHIMVQKRASYDKLQEFGADSARIHRLGYIHPFRKENNHKPEALICTHSDRIEHCRDIIRALPGMHFHIAAITEMSSVLMDLGTYDNVSLYPGALPEIFDELFDKCDYYFDINYREEIVAAVRTAFLYNHLIFAFEETAHNREYVADAHIYPAEEFNRMIADVEAAMENVTFMERHLDMQHKEALAEKTEMYAEFMKAYA